MHAFLRRQAAEKERVRVLRLLEAEIVDHDRVRHRADPGEVGRRQPLRLRDRDEREPQRPEVFADRPAGGPVRCDDRRNCRTQSREWCGQRVVVDDVDVCVREQPPDRCRVADLLHGSLRCSEPGRRGRQGSDEARPRPARPGCHERYVVAPVDQSFDQVEADALDPAVAARRNLEPRRRHDGDSKTLGAVYRSRHSAGRRAAGGRSGLGHNAGETRRTTRVNLPNHASVDADLSMHHDHVRRDLPSGVVTFSLLRRAGLHEAVARARRSSVVGGVDGAGSTSTPLSVTSCTSLALVRDRLVVSGVAPASDFLDDLAAAMPRCSCPPHYRWLANGRWTRRNDWCTCPLTNCEHLAHDCRSETFSACLRSPRPRIPEVRQGSNSLARPSSPRDNDLQLRDVQLAAAALQA